MIEGIGLGPEPKDIPRRQAQNIFDDQGQPFEIDGRGRRLIPDSLEPMVLPFLLGPGCMDKPYCEEMGGAVRTRGMWYK